MQPIRGILISTLAPLENHIANGGDKLLGNASSIKKGPDGRVYISGQMQRHALFSAMRELNFDDEHRGDTFVSNGDGITDEVERDLRADMGGFLHTSAGSYSGRRISPISVTPAEALHESAIGQDLLIRLKANEDDSSKSQALATLEYSQADLMLMNFHLDVGNLSTSKRYEYENEMNVGVNYAKHAPDAERKRRARLFLESVFRLQDYAKQGRNAVSAEPQRVLIVLDPVLSRKAIRYFKAGETEKNNLLKELQHRGAKVIVGDDTQGDKSVFEALEEAKTFLAENPLFDPTQGEDEILTYKEAFNIA